MALLETFQVDCEVTLATGAPFDCARLNKAYHSVVDAARIRVRVAPMPEFVRNAKAGDAIRGAFFDRFLKSIGHEYDLCISSYDFADFGRPAIQLVADFSWDDAMRRASDPATSGLRGLLHRSRPARWAYLAGAAVIGGHYDPRAKPRDMVVANSKWTADLLARRHGIRASVIYPPVYAPPYDAALARTGDFVMLGRISPDKRVTEAMDILDRVRARGHVLRLHIVGPLDGSAYSDRVRKEATAHGDWVCLHGGLYGDEKFSELARHSFGIHMHRREAFGIAVAEMVKMGLVPFVPKDTAPAEIVGDERLCLGDADDAVEVIDRLLTDRLQQAAVREKLTTRAALFSKERFVKDVRALIAKQPETAPACASAPDR